MRKILTLLSFSLLAAAPSLHAAGRVEVTYVEPEKFMDIGFGSVDRKIALDEMTAILTRLGEKLPDGQTLKLEVTHINLAGEVRPGAGRDIRVMTGTADWPEVALRYTLQAGGQTLKGGEAKVYDIAYLTNATFVDRVGTNLPYERHMLRKWFAATFGNAPQP